jgi:hypothetical protein
VLISLQTYVKNQREKKEKSQLDAQKCEMKAWYMSALFQLRQYQPKMRHYWDSKIFFHIILHRPRKCFDHFCSVWVPQLRNWVGVSLSNSSPIRKPISQFCRVKNSLSNELRMESWNCVFWSLKKKIEVLHFLFLFGFAAEFIFAKFQRKIMLKTKKLNDMNKQKRSRNMRESQSICSPLEFLATIFLFSEAT